MSEKVHSPVYGVKTETPEDFPLAILEKYLESNESNFWTINDNLSQESKDTMEKANKRVDAENEALKKAIAKLKNEVELSKLEEQLTDKNLIIATLTHLFKQIMDIRNDAEMKAEIYEMPKGVSATSFVSITWKTDTLFTEDLKKIMELGPDCCTDPENGYPSVDVRVNSTYYDEESHSVKSYEGEFEVEINVHFTESEWEKYKQMK